MVQPNGHQSYRRSAGRQSRWNINTAQGDAILARSVDVPAMLIRGDGKRPDSMTLVPWSGGRTMV